MKDRIFDHSLKQVVDQIMEADDLIYDISELENVTQWTVLNEEDNGDIRTSTKEWCAHAQIPKALQHIVTPKMLTWLEHGTWNREKCSYDFRIEPHYLSRKISCRGRTVFKEAEGGKCQRVFKIELIVNIPVFGSMAENVILGLLKKNEVQDYEYCRDALKKELG